MTVTEVNGPPGAGGAPNVWEMTLWAVVLAGGRGERLRREVNKVYLPLGGRPVLEYSLSTFNRAAGVAGMVVVGRPEDREPLAEVLERLPAAKPIEVIGGGATRHRSEQAGIEALAPRIESGEIDFVAVHDGARPFVSLDLVEAVAAEARRRGGAVPALRVESPLYSRTGPVAVALDTAAIRRVQTPQIFAAGPLLEGYRRAALEGFEGVDTAETVTRYTEVEVGTVAGDVRNLKVTFVEDLLEAEDLARSFEDGRWVEAETR